LHASRPSIDQARVKRPEVSFRNARPAHRKLVSAHSGRKLELMVLRTYERSDGKRFARLLPLSGVRSALAFQPDHNW